MHRTSMRSTTAAGAALSALILIGCDATDPDREKVLEKRAFPATGPIYESVERPAACRASRTQPRTSLAKPNPPKPKPRGDTSDDKPAVKNPPRTDTSKVKPPRSAPGKGGPSAPCGTTSVPVFKGFRTPAKWELKLQDGKETDWETVTRDEYDSVEVGDQF